jgi:hypothetical protein
LIGRAIWLMERALRAAKRGRHCQKGKVAQIWQSNLGHLENVGLSLLIAAKPFPPRLN